MVALFVVTQSGVESFESDKARPDPSALSTSTQAGRVIRSRAATHSGPSGHKTAATAFEKGPARERKQTLLAECRYVLCDRRAACALLDS
jgi:hypothetical protein